MYEFISICYAPIFSLFLSHIYIQVQCTPILWIPFFAYSFYNFHRIEMPDFFILNNPCFYLSS